MPEPVPPAALPPGGPGRFRRVLGAVAASVGLTAVFAISLVGSVLLHLDLPPTRRTARTIANQLFADLFQGKLVVGEIDRLSLHGVTVRSAEAFDPGGARIVSASGIRADADVLAIVKSAVAGKGDLQVTVPLIRLDHADIALQRGPDGGAPTIAQTFLPRKPGPPAPPDARKVRVLLDRIEIGHVWAHGDVAPPVLDAEVAQGLGHLEVGPDGLVIDAEVSRTDCRSPLPQPLAGSTTFRLRGGANGMRMEAGFEGKLGELAVHTEAQLTGNHVAARVEVPHATAGAIASLVPGPPPKIPLRVPVSAVIEAEGEIPEIVFKTRFDVEGGGQITADGSLALRSPLTVDVSLGVAGVDPRAVLDVPEATPLNAKAHVWIAAGAGDVKIDADAVTEPFSLAGNVVPAVDAKASLSHGKLKGAVKVDELGAPLHATFTFDPAEEDLRFDAETTVASLRGIKRVAIPMEGSGTVKVKGALRKGKLDAQVSARARGLHGPPAVAVESAAVDAHLSGPLAALNVDATVEGSGVQSGVQDFQSVKAHASGPLLAPKVDALLDAGGGESLSVSAAVDAKAKAATDVKVQLSRKQGTVGGTVARVAAAPGGIKLEGLSLVGEGMGALKGGLVVVGKEITGKLHGENVDLEKVAHLAHYPGTLKGLANVDVELSSSRPGSRTGHVAVEMVDGDVGLLRGISGAFTATFDGDRVRTDGLLRVVNRAGEGERESERCDGAIAQIRVSGGDGRLPGALLDGASWSRLSGRIEVAADEWNLRCLRRLVPPFVSVPEVRGKLTTRVEIERAPGARLPTVKRLFARTKGLEVVDSSWESLHTDVEVNASVDGQSGETDAKVAILDGDTLAEVALGARLDLAALLDRPEERLSILRKAPLRGHVKVPRRAFTAFAGLPTFVTDRLPVLTGKGGQTLAGEIEVDGQIEGTLDAPRIEERVLAHQVADVMIVQRAAPPGPDGKGPQAPQPAQEPVLGPWGMPVDAEVVTRYDGKKATLDVHVDHQGRKVLTASGELAMPIADLLEGRFRPRGSFHAAFDQVPLGAVPFFADRGVDGKLTGKVDVEGIGDKPSVDAKLELPGLTVGRVRYDEAELSLELRKPQQTKSGDRSEGKVQLTFKGGTGGALTASVSQEVGWRDGLVPVVGPESAARLELRASRFRLAVAEPFVDGAVSRLDGLLDGEAHLSFQPDEQKGGGTRVGNVDLKLTNGVFHLPQLGQEFHGLTLTIAREEKGKLVFKDIRAEGTKGLVTGSGSAELIGLLPRRTDLTFTIKPGEELPLSLQGAPLGDARGETKIHVEAKDWSSFQVTISNDLHLDLSPALTRSFTVEKETDNPDIAILHAAPREEPEQPEAQGQASGGTAIELDFKPLKVGLKGKLLGRVPVQGTLVGNPQRPLRVVLGGRRPKISGVIDLPRFTIGILHKEFEIEGGSVTLNPDDLEKSFINVSARWDSPDGPLYVEYAGELGQLSVDKLKEKLKCRADNLSQERCFNALLLGTDQGTAAGGGQAQQGQALAAQVIASEFSTEIVGGLSTSIGTGDDGSFRPGLVYKKGNLTTELSTYGAGASSATTTSAGGAAPKGQHSLLTLDWRFWRNWSMRGKIDVGSDQQTYGADILWQYRY